MVVSCYRESSKNRIRIDFLSQKKRQNMCGICGQFNYVENSPVDVSVVRAMARALSHRGPDDEGYHFSGSIGLGFRRLSIIDLEGGHQPMSDSEETIWVVFNGEIYNFPELRVELESQGYIFRTKSDTEVIIHGYKHWDDDVLQHLNGIFGLAIWDERKQKLILARDRLGVKPVYYKIQDGSLWFASEMRSITTSERGKPDVDPVAINLFLRYRYTPSPLTIINGIKKLAPGTKLTVEKGRYLVERWWKYQPIPFDPLPDFRQAEDDLLHLYKRAVKRQLISDVPLGLLLSGGVDSGLLLALMEAHGSDWQTFTVGFGDEFRDDELDAAANTARILGARNSGIKMEKKDFDDIFSKVVWALEEPIAASSAIPMYSLCEHVRSKVKVALMGQGPDELFGGYKRHIGVQYGRYWRALPKPFRKLMGSVVGYLPRNEAAKRAIYSLDVQERMVRYQHVFSLMSGGFVDSLFQDGILPDGAGDRILECWQGLEPMIEYTDELGGFQFLEVRSALPDELLLYADKLSMAHGLEIRVPFLDQEVVEYAEKLPASYKVRNGSGKWIHKQVCKRFLPDEIIKRRKLGFVTPVDEWFRQGVYGGAESSLLDNNAIMYNYFQYERVQQLIKEHRSGRHNHFKILFSLLFLNAWFNTFLS
ncbi:MAG: asparagine synthase (glutamine-hydrolyzing) [Proteobacteria bacterium]|nr:asparagine synthase (glutamine-hydrolyzing) [Pseudomonadota bacterium]